MDYDLKTGLDQQLGCTITGCFYSPLSPTELNDAIKELQELVRYVETPATINGVQINKS